MVWLLQNLEWMVLLVGAAVIARVFLKQHAQAKMQREAGAANDNSVTKA